SENGPVQHDRRAFLALRIDVVRAQPSRQVQVDLPGPALPLPADGVLEHELELRAVERALPSIDDVLDAGRAGSLLERRLGAIPDLVAADALLRSVGELHQHVVEAEIAVD